MKPLLSALVLLLPLLTAPPAQAQFMEINTIIAGIGDSAYLDAAAEANDTSSVRVVKLSSLRGGPSHAERLARARDIKAADIAFLQSNLAINPLARIALRNSGVALEQIVSIMLFGDGAAIIFADDL